MAEGSITPEGLGDTSVSKPEPTKTRLPDQDAEEVRASLQRAKAKDDKKHLAVGSEAGINRPGRQTSTSGLGEALREEAEYKGTT